MAQIKVDSKLENKTTNTTHEINTKAILKDKKIQYKDQSCMVEIILKKDTIEMIRKEGNTSFEFHFCLGNSWCKCHLLEYNRKVKLNIIVNKMKIESNYFEIDYQLEEGDKFHFKFNYK